MYCNILNVCMFRMILGSLMKDAVHPQLYKVKRIRVDVERETCINTKCFQLFFTFFPDGRTPEQLPSGLWNCSVALYPIFQHHLACNLKADCEDGRDESSRCPFSSAECEGLVDLCDRCYKFVDVESEIGHEYMYDDNRYTQAKQYCLSLGGSDKITELSYTLVCDFIQDCPDRSDESFCRHPVCVNTFTCTSSGQCLSYGNLCDRIDHCHDQSDENNCRSFRRLDAKHTMYPFPALVNFDSLKWFVSVAMNSTEPCPDSHYRCPGDFNDCLPVYTRCNVMHDCIDGQDEDGCEDRTCPGFFRCRAATVCVHSDHLCDGWPHCPLHDDELGCEEACPYGCRCLGHSFRCPQPFTAATFRQLRSLDATGSGMTVSDVNSNTYLICLVLSQGLSTLRFISSENHRLCCKHMLPSNHEDLSCHAPADEVSSCEDLLLSWTYRGLLWLVTILSLTGNVFCLCARLLARGMAFSSGFNVFVTNLTIADFLMGVYMAIIGVTDERYRGRYLYHDDAWKSSVTSRL
ncbi:hypothetical protein ACOMHN_056418 [Nucella lapillus]